VGSVLSLFSGSLASRVAARLIERHPDLECLSLVHFRSPFSWEIDDLRLLVRDEWPGIPFRTQSLKRDYRRLVVPNGSFRLAENCYVCRSQMLGRAARFMERTGADFIVTGEMVGQHGVSADDLRRMEQELGIEGRVIRPLCLDAEMLLTGDLREWLRAFDTVTDPDSCRERLQALAEFLGLDPADPMSCARRCKMMMPGFGDRVVNLFSEDGFTLNALRLLDFEIYYKVHPDIKIVVARTEQEKRDLQNLMLPQDLRVYPSTPHGPMTLVRAEWGTRSLAKCAEIIELAARITATHTERNGDGTVAIPVYHRFENQDETLLVNARPFDSPEQIACLEMVEVYPHVEVVQEVSSG